MVGLVDSKSEFVVVISSGSVLVTIGLTPCHMRGGSFANSLVWCYTCGGGSIPMLSGFGISGNKCTRGFLLHRIRFVMVVIAWSTAAMHIGVMFGR